MCLEVSNEFAMSMDHVGVQLPHQTRCGRVRCVYRPSTRNGAAVVLMGTGRVTSFNA